MPDFLRWTNICVERENAVLKTREESHLRSKADEQEWKQQTNKIYKHLIAIMDLKFFEKKNTTSNNKWLGLIFFLFFIKWY